jgi:hypothetical protein
MPEVWSGIEIPEGMEIKSDTCLIVFEYLAEKVRTKDLPVVITWTAPDSVNKFYKDVGDFSDDLPVPAAIIKALTNNKESGAIVLASLIHMLDTMLINDPNNPDRPRRGR